MGDIMSNALIKKQIKQCDLSTLKGRRKLRAILGEKPSRFDVKDIHLSNLVTFMNSYFHYMEKSQLPIYRIDDERITWDTSLWGQWESLFGHDYIWSAFSFRNFHQKVRVNPQDSLSVELFKDLTQTTASLPNALQNKGYHSRNLSQWRFGELEPDQEQWDRSIKCLGIMKENTTLFYDLLFRYIQKKLDNSLYETDNLRREDLERILLDVTQAKLFVAGLKDRSEIDEVNKKDFYHELNASERIQSGLQADLRLYDKVV